MGLLDMLGGLGTTPPSYMEGLLGAQATEDLRKRSIGSGLVNALIGYAAMPKNENLGLGRILAGAAQQGLAGARGVYDQAGQDLFMQQRLDEMKRTQARTAREDEQQIASRNAIDMLLQRPEVANDPMAVAFIRANPAEALKQYTTPRERKTATVGNQVIDLNTNEVIFTGDRERKTSRVDAGNKILVVDDATGETIREIPKGLAPQAPKEPKALYSNTPTDTSSGLVYMPTPEALKLGYTPISATTGRPVTDLQTKTQATATATKEKQDAKESAQLNQANKMIGKVDSALKNVSGLTTGAGKAFTPTSLESVTGAADLQADLDTIAANLGFAELQAMRDSSPTGGALGSIAVRELDLLQATVASLSTAQTPEQLKRNLQEVKTHYENWTKTVKGVNPDAQPSNKKSKQSNLSAQDREALNWANANPTDPRSAAIKQKIGL